jgi:hypothetical protein
MQAKALHVRGKSDLRALFDKADSDADGVLSASEWQSLLGLVLADALPSTPAAAASPTAAAGVGKAAAAVDTVSGGSPRSLLAAQVLTDVCSPLFAIADANKDKRVDWLELRATFPQLVSAIGKPVASCCDRRSRVVSCHQIR